MRALRAPWTAALALLVAAAAAQLPVGPEQQVNEYTTSYQKSARVAGTPDGGFVLAWLSAGPCHGELVESNAQARRFLASGEPAGLQFRVNGSCDPYRQEYPRSVLVDEDGEFTVVWSETHSRPWGMSYGGSAQRFAADGTALGAEFVVAPVSEYGEGPAAGGAPNGEFVVARGIEDYYSYIYHLEVSRFEVSGNPVWSFAIDPPAGHALGRPDVNVAPTGDFIVAWMDASSPVFDLRMRRFDVDGAPVGGVVDVTGPGAIGWRTAPRMGRNDAGNLLVVWQDDVSTGGDTSFSSIQGRAFDAAGSPLGSQFQVNDETIGRQIAGSVTAAPDGSFVVAWMDDPFGEPGGGDGSGAGIRARKVSANGELLGPGFAVNAYTTGAQSYPSAAFLAGGDFVVAWSSDGSFGDDDSGSSIQVRRFRHVLFADGFESGDTSRWSGTSGKS